MPALGSSGHPAKRLKDGGFKQSDDQRLVIATLSLALRLRPDFVVLAAGDGDFAPMVWELRNEGIRTEVLGEREEPGERSAPGSVLGDRSR